MRVFVIAGEASGDRLGAALMAGLKSLTGVTFDGVGGPLMQAEGLASRFPMDELSVMGLAEILPKYRALKRRIAEMADAVIETRPDVLITIDSPDFCLRVAKRVKARSDIRVVHYVAPTVWAWRPGRAVRMARHVDQVLALFPFEPPLMEAAGMRCDFVGHPVVAEPPADPDALAALRYAVPKGPRILLLPGSRKGEIARLADTFGAVAGQVRKAHRDATFLLPTTHGTDRVVREAIADWPVAPLVIGPEARDRKAAAFALADAALAASGTVSLELAAHRTPMVIAYDMAWLSRVIIRRMLLVDTVTLVNLVSETRAVPEYIGADCRPEPIAEALLGVLADPTAQHAAMDLTMERLGRGQEAPGLRAARAVLDGLELSTNSPSASNPKPR